MVNVCAQNKQYGIIEIGHIHLGAFVGTTDGDFRSIVLGVGHIEGTGHGRGGLPLGAVAGLDGAHFHGAFFASKCEHIAFNGGRTLGDLKRHGKTRSGRSLKGNGVVERQLVGDVGEVDELGCQTSRHVTYGEVVETAVAAIEQKDVVPHGRVEFVAAARGKTRIDALYFGHGLVFTAVGIVHLEQRDSTGTVVGIKVYADFPAIPLLMWLKREGVCKLVVG